MNVLIVEHSTYEVPGIISDWANNNNHKVEITKPYLGELNNKIDFDFLIFLGGPQSPLEIEKNIYINDEINLAKEALNKNKTILGICLGAQIIAEAVGIKTLRSPEKEYGIYPIELLPGAQENKIFFDFPVQFDAISWHNDMPGIDEKIKMIAKTKGCTNQAFLYRENILGLQFHLEIRNKDLENLFNAEGDRFGLKGKYIMSKSEIYNHDLTEMNKMMHKILDRLTALN